jgi:hypothetical protein
MTKIQARLVIMADEWLGAALCLYLWRMHDEAFWPVLSIWATLVYLVSYPLYWWGKGNDW